MLETLVVDEEVEANPRGVWYVDSPEFHEPRAKMKIRRPVHDLYKKGSDPDDFAEGGELREYAHTLHHPILTPEAERHFFRLMNFTRFEMNEIILSANGNRNALKPREQRWLKTAEEKSLAINNGIAKLNIRLCAHWARKLRMDVEDVRDLFEELHVPLESSIRRFDYTRDTKFSTFASNAMIHHMQRLRSYAHRDATHFPTGHNLVQCEDTSFNPDGVRAPIRSKLLALVEQIPNPQARNMVKDYYGLNGSTESMNFPEIASRYGFTKQNARDVVNRAVQWIKGMVKKQNIDEEQISERLSWNELENG
jgi:RNA polymerase sigma factor (sigma-70 family)